MTSEVLIKLVEDIMNVENKTEAEIEQLLNTLKQHVPDPAVSDLIYFDDLTPQEILTKALNYKITLPDVCLK